MMGIVNLRATRTAIELAAQWRGATPEEGPYGAVVFRGKAVAPAANVVRPMPAENVRQFDHAGPQAGRARWRASRTVRVRASLTAVKWV
jgi:hypothetical protein